MRFRDDVMKIEIVWFVLMEGENSGVFMETSIWKEALRLDRIFKNE
jgi:hypothetical protein